jgi:uncharacterized protein YdaU (DUF1376 family)
MKDTKPKGRAPAFQFYADDFLAGTMTMTNEERGAYISLLCLQWSKGFVTELDIQRICLGMPTHSHGICQSKFQADPESKYRNQRLEVERSKQKERSQKQSDIANLRWNKDAKAMPTHYQEDAKAYAESVPEVCFPSPSPSPIIKIQADKPPRVRFQKPTVEELTAEAIKIGLPVTEVDKFFNYYESNGWKVGKNSMKSWPATMKGWLSRLGDASGLVGCKGAANTEVDWRKSI